MDNLDKVFRKIYYDINSPGGFSGVQNLYKEVVKINPKITLTQTKKWLSSQLVYTLHKSARRKYKRNPIIAEKPNQKMQIDLIDMKMLSKENSSYQYLLSAIDVFSKKAFVIPLKNKNNISIRDAMESVLIQHQTNEIQSDNGTEFKNRSFKALTNKYNINHYFTKNSEIKSAIVERFNRTIKNKLFRYMTLKGNRKYLDVLSNFVDNYNNTFHRSIKMTPNRVTFDNSPLVFRNLYGFASKREMLRKLIKPKLSVGQPVRTKYLTKNFDRGYYANWSDQIHSVFKTIPGLKKPYYQIKSEDGSTVDKRFYPEDLQTVYPNLYRIEKILKTKTVRGKKQYYVKWLNHPDKYNSWIDAKEVTKLNG